MRRSDVRPPPSPARRGARARRRAARAERPGAPADRPQSGRRRRLQLRGVQRPGRQVDAVASPQGAARGRRHAHRAGRHAARRGAPHRGPRRPLPGPARRGPGGRSRGGRLGPRLQRSGGPVPVAPDLAERATLQAVLERAAEAHRAPVLAAERLADRVLAHLALVLEQVLDEGDLAVAPELHLLLVVLGAGGGRRPAGEARPRAPLAGGLRAHRLTSGGTVGFSAASPPSGAAVSRSNRGDVVRCLRPSSGASVYGSCCSPGSSSSSPVADSGGAMSSRSRPAASTPIVAWMRPPTIITTAPTTYPMKIWSGSPLWMSAPNSSGPPNPPTIVPVA